MDYDYNWWDDRTVEEYKKGTNHPCYGCRDFVDGECISDGACASNDHNVQVES